VLSEKSMSEMNEAESICIVCGNLQPLWGAEMISTLFVVVIFVLIGVRGVIAFAEAFQSLAGDGDVPHNE